MKTETEAIPGYSRLPHQSLSLVGDGATLNRTERRLVDRVGSKLRRKIQNTPKPTPKEQIDAVPSAVAAAAAAAADLRRAMSKGGSG